LQQDYISSGEEQYLTIGNFIPSPNTIEKQDSSMVKSTNDIILTPPINDLVFAKEKKHSKKDNEKFRAEVRKKNLEQKAKIQSMINAQTLNSYHIRYYFDDLYLGQDSLNKDTLKQKYITLQILFETGKATLLNESFEELDKTVTFLELQSVKAIIHGHTDKVGNEVLNKRLSENRAKAVFAYLISKGINSSLLSYKGWGSLKPISDNNTDIGKEKNRRVELEIIRN
jgi:outer membrane protein OmpA-like peptidoglycan-associated protein